MSTVTASTLSQGTATTLPPARKPRPVAEFLSTYVFSKDHKVIGLQFLFSTLLWFLIGGLLALAHPRAARLDARACHPTRRCACAAAGRVRALSFQRHPRPPEDSR